MSHPVRVGISHGDINGIGYEVIFKTLANEGITELFTPVVFGHEKIARQALDLLGIDNLKLNIVKSAREVSDGVVNLVELDGKLPEVAPGKVTEAAGKSAFDSLEKAIEALKNGEINVLVTAPISKEAMQTVGFGFPGHTEYLEDRVGEDEKAQMILFDDNLRVALVTTHLPLSEISRNITTERIVETVKSFSHTLKRDFGFERPSIAVLSLNPHCGDGGVLGKEEDEIIRPAISTLREEGVLAFGPFSSDGFFGHGDYKKFDGVVAMYHDQGLAPFKTLAGDGGVNFTAALPFVRTSPDHGTGFGIAWKGEADNASMREAIYKAIDIFRRRKTFDKVSSNPLPIHSHERHDKEERNGRFARDNQNPIKGKEPDVDQLNISEEELN